MPDKINNITEANIRFTSKFVHERTSYKKGIIDLTFQRIGGMLGSPNKAGLRP